MPNLYVSKRPDGRFTGKVRGNKRASLTAATQREVIEGLKKMHPEGKVLTQRVGYRAGKPGPDKFRRG